MKINIGVICPSEIAFRRFMPALSQNKNYTFVGIGVCTGEERFGKDYQITSATQDILNSEREKAEKFTNEYGGKIFDGYENIISSDEIDAIYLPLPPALHFQWAKRALMYGKHVLVEKPATISYEDSEELVCLAQSKGLALHENYMFAFHSQLDKIQEIINSGEIGDVRLYRLCFGFPRRSLNDFRYNKALGGGALIDAGGYVIKYSAILLGESSEIMYANMNYCNEFEVDIFGSGAMSNEKGETVQFSYGMDNDYKCELEVWGSKGTIYTGRVLTAPVGFRPEVIIKRGSESTTLVLESDDTFYKSLTYFERCIKEIGVRNESYSNILNQAKMVDSFREIVNR